MLEFFDKKWLNLIARLLHLANSVRNNERFFAIKERLLRKHGQFAGHVVQHIKDGCWGTESEECGPLCRKCGGTGIYSEVWVIHHSIAMGGYTFLLPVCREYTQPMASVDIVGRIKRQYSGLVEREAELWLYLLIGEWEPLRIEMTSTWIDGWYLYPLLNIQRVLTLAILDWKANSPDRFHGEKRWVVPMEKPVDWNVPF